jgi:antirestriction protein ArdC
MGGNLDGRAVLPLRYNGIAYRGVNILALWMAALANGYRSPIWMTFRQALALGGLIQAYLGHRSIISTVRYTALTPNRFKNFWKD